MAETTQSAGGLEILDSIFGYLNKTKNAVFETYSQWQATFGSENAMDGGGIMQRVKMPVAGQTQIRHRLQVARQIPGSISVSVWLCWPE
ncbi:MULTISPECIES: hypothetical protein [Thalassospira]|uniref:hypothetical protein n=1 Tax=Thalassospira TaxID=168934 RepID=UPI0008276C4E|nr:MULTISPECIES: hypothetical protein [Thalassospira]OCK09007.1 hypothetical protein KO164_3186 [Thalassospira sp. KO164]SEE63531.1 hypothetical protein SAMN04515623_3218 [Thalassospira permensis]